MRTKSIRMFSSVLMAALLVALAVAFVHPVAAQGPTPTLPSGWTTRAGVGVQLALPAEMTDIKPTEAAMKAALAKFKDTKPNAATLISTMLDNGNYAKNIFFAIDNTDTSNPIMSVNVRLSTGGAKGVTPADMLKGLTDGMNAAGFKVVNSKTLKIGSLDAVQVVMEVPPQGTLVPASNMVQVAIFKGDDMYFITLIGPLLPATVQFTEMVANTFVVGTPAPARPAPPKEAKELTGADWDKLAAETAKSIGFTDFAYEAWELPPATTWDSILQVYADQIAQAGLKDKATTQDIKGGKLAIWVNDDASGAVVVYFIASSDGTKSAYVLALGGTLAPSGASSSSSSSASSSSASTASSSSASSSSASSSASSSQIPPGKAGLLVKSFYGDEINFTIAGKLYKIPANGETLIVLDPGKYNLSANIPGKGELTDTIELLVDQGLQYTFAAQ